MIHGVLPGELVVEISILRVKSAYSCESVRTWRSLRLSLLSLRVLPESLTVVRCESLLLVKVVQESIWFDGLSRKFLSSSLTLLVLRVAILFLIVHVLQIF